MYLTNGFPRRALYGYTSKVRDEEHLCGITRAEANAIKKRRARRRKNSFAKVRK